MYQQAKQECPQDEKDELAIYCNNLGITYTKLLDGHNAIIEFTNAIEYNPKYLKPLYHRMNLYLQK